MVMNFVIGPWNVVQQDNTKLFRILLELPTDVHCLRQSYFRTKSTEKLRCSNKRNLSSPNGAGREAEGAGDAGMNAQKNNSTMMLCNHTSFYKI